MCCIIGDKDTAKPTCCCCCNITCGAAMIFIFQVIALIASFSYGDIMSGLLATLTCGVFLWSFIDYKNVFPRTCLFWYYLGYLAVMVIYLLYLSFSGKFEDIFTSLCGVGDFLSTEEQAQCVDTFTDLIGLFLAIYWVVYLTFQLSFVRILYYYMQKGVRAKQQEGDYVELVTTDPNLI